jgi:hypothetical protein
MWFIRAAVYGGFMILASLPKTFVLACSCAAFLALSTVAAQAQQSRQGTSQTRPSKPQKPAQTRPSQARPAQKPAQSAPASAPGGASATLVASFEDWGVYTAQSGRSKICYALSQPKDRLPKGLNRDPAYLFVSFRPAENVENEVALVMGFPTKEDAPAEAAIGTTSYALLPKEENAWLKDPAQEDPAIASMMKGSDLLVKVQSQRGNQLTDRYSLIGFTKALERARKECS